MNGQGLHNHVNMHPLHPAGSLRLPRAAERRHELPGAQGLRTHLHGMRREHVRPAGEYNVSILEPHPVLGRITLDLTLVYPMTAVVLRFPGVYTFIEDSM